MIRRMEPSDLDTVMDIWLEGNLQAHPFVPARYWRDNLERVREQLPLAEVSVYVEPAGIQGFLGLTGDHIAGLFVREDARSRGIGRRLLEAAKERRGRLTLCVYERSQGAMKFYRREGFSVEQRRADAATGAAEFFMVWER